MKLNFIFAAVLSAISMQFPCVAIESSQAAIEPQGEAFTPEGLLATGVDSLTSINPYTGESGKARKGIIAATLNNVVLLNTLLSAKDSPDNQAKIKKITDAITSLLPSLRVVGVFDLFTPGEWLATESQPGRVLTAMLYLQEYPQDITPEIKQHLKQLQTQTKINVISDNIATLLKES